eukprot:5294164-Amphidinium_carterae.1
MSTLEEQYAARVDKKTVRCADYFRRRGMWSSDGAGNSYLFWVDEENGKTSRVKLKRRASLQQMSWESFVEALKREAPRILFSWSDKFEN